MSRPGPRCNIIYYKTPVFAFRKSFPTRRGTASRVGYYACVGELEYIILLLYWYIIIELCVSRPFLDLSICSAG